MIVDDHEVVRLGLRSLLEAEDDLHVVAEASTASEAVRLAGQEQPDLVLMDVRLPDASGLEACREIRRQWPRIQVLVLTSFADQALVIEAIEAGASGYVLKQLDTKDLLKAIRAVEHGDAVLDPAVTRGLLATIQTAQRKARSAAFGDLSERELDVLVLVADGKTNAEIAEALSISEKTARNHVSAILAKLGVTNRIEAATFAVRNHLTSLGRGGHSPQDG